MVVTARRSLLALGALLALGPVARAADPKPVPPAPDADFLEYLGSSDATEPELQEYLAKTDGGAGQDAKPAPKRGSAKT
ncbi:MAG: hypothetical protein JSR54_12895 [Proteobacteria bacterium]|nr:hypothetical protein [Pseudomonadota bacterium]